MERSQNWQDLLHRDPKSEIYASKYTWITWIDGFMITRKFHIDLKKAKTSESNLFRKQSHLTSWPEMARGQNVRKCAERMPDNTCRRRRSVLGKSEGFLDSLPPLLIPLRARVGSSCPAAWQWKPFHARHSWRTCRAIQGPYQEWRYQAGQRQRCRSRRVLLHAFIRVETAWYQCHSPV